MRSGVKALAYAKNVTVWMPDVHLSDIPRHVRGRKGYVQALTQTLPVNLIDIIHKHRHPDPFVSLLVASRSEGGRVRSSPASSLAILAEENLARTSADRPKGCRCSPIPQFLPAPLLEPRKTLGDVGDVQNWIDAVHKHSPERIALSRMTVETWRYTYNLSPGSGWVGFKVRSGFVDNVLPSNLPGRHIAIDEITGFHQSPGADSNIYWHWDGRVIGDSLDHWPSHGIDASFHFLIVGNQFQIAARMFHRPGHIPFVPIEQRKAFLACGDRTARL